METMEAGLVSLEKKCAACGVKKSTSVKLQKCSKCTSIRYCSRTCQKQGWSSHKPRCKEIVARQDADAARLKDLFDLGAQHLKENQMSQFETIISENPDLIKFENEEFLQVTLLFISAQYNRTRAVSFLLERMMFVDVENSRGWTALHIGSALGHEGIVKLLLDKGANVNHRTTDGGTALYIACQNSRKEIVKILLHREANFSIPTNGGSTPLQIASEKGLSHIVKMLLDRGANVDLAPNDGMTPLLLASQNGHQDIVKMLLKQSNVNEHISGNSTPLYVACQNGHRGIVTMLLKKNAVVNVETSAGGTALSVACQNGNEDVVRLLLDEPVLVDHQSPHNGQTPLIIASALGFKNIVKMLLLKGADVDLKDNAGGTALHFAQHKQHHDVVKLLFTHLAHRDNSSSTELGANGARGDFKFLVL